MKPSRRVVNGTAALGGVFEHGFLSIYSPKKRRFANKVAVAAGVVSVGLVGYAFWRSERRR